MLRIERQGSVDVIRPRGPLRGELLDDVREAAKRLIRRGCPAVVLDLGQTLLLSSLALEWIQEFDRECAERGGAFSLAAGSDLCKETLRVTGVGQRVQQFDDCVEAIGRFAK
jgi:anti-anti-sigma regulatory factor